MKTRYGFIGLVALVAIAFAGMPFLQEPAVSQVVNTSPQSAANASSTPTEQTGTAKTDKKALVVYFSYTGNTRTLATQIRQSVGGDIFELQPATPYSTDYDTVVKQGKQEVESGYKPPLKSKVDNLTAYDVIFIGTPIWWYTIAPPVATFLAESDLAGKTIIPFCTHGGYGAGHSAEDIKKLAPKATVLDELVLNGSQSYSQTEISVWLNKVGFNKS